MNSTFKKVLEKFQVQKNNTSIDLVIDRVNNSVIICPDSGKPFTFRDAKTKETLERWKTVAELISEAADKALEELFTTESESDVVVNTDHT